MRVAAPHDGPGGHRGQTRVARRLEKRGSEIGLAMDEVVEQRLIAGATAAGACREHARAGTQTTYTVVPLGANTHIACFGVVYAACVLWQRACRIRLCLW